MSSRSLKLGARARHELAEGTLRGSVEFLLRDEAPLSPEQVQMLTQTGCKVRYVTGPIASCEADVQNLDRIAELAFVANIEVARALYGEGI
jgi:hypothetical protein